MIKNKGLRVNMENLNENRENMGQASIYENFKLKECILSQTWP